MTWQHLMFKLEDQCQFFGNSLAYRYETLFSMHLKLSTRNTWIAEPGETEANKTVDGLGGGGWLGEFFHFLGEKRFVYGKQR